MRRALAHKVLGLTKSELFAICLFRSFTSARSSSQSGPEMTLWLHFGTRLRSVPHMRETTQTSGSVLAVPLPTYPTLSASNPEVATYSLPKRCPYIKPQSRPRRATKLRPAAAPTSLRVRAARRSRAGTEGPSRWREPSVLDTRSESVYGRRRPNISTGSDSRDRAVRRKWYSGGCCVKRHRTGPRQLGLLLSIVETTGVAWTYSTLYRRFVAVRPKREKLEKSASTIKFWCARQMQRRTTSHPGMQPGSQREHRIEPE